MRHTTDSTKSKKNLSTFAVISESTNKQDMSCEKVKSTKKNLMEVSAFDPNSTEKKRELKGNNKENIKVIKIEAKISMTNDKENDKKTRGGKESVKSVAKTE